MKDEKSFRSAQTKFILSSAIVYAFFYLTRKNLLMA
jgi:sugar phosphate permease